jgi:glycosyltransferase involved in cell wall biosynthesis
MDVLLALTYYWPHRTGLTLHAQYVAEGLAARGHKVTVLTSHFLDSLPREQTLNGVRVVRLRCLQRISRGQVMPGFPLAAYRLLQEHEVVSIHSPMLESALLAGLGKRMGRGIVITHHGDLTLPRGLLNSAIEVVVRRLFHYAADKADHIIAYSDDYAEHSVYVKSHIEKTTALYPPVQMPAPTPDGRERVRRRLGIGETPLIGYSGRFVEEKRPDLLLRALPHLEGRLPGAHIAFAGQYIMPYEHFYQQSLPLIERWQDRVHFLGLIEDEQELADFYSACDVLTLPSSSECFGLVQVESMLCGTPVIATDIPGAREPVRVTGMGEIVRQRDSLALAGAIERVVKDRERYIRPREEIASRFDFQRTLQGYEDLLQDAADRHRGS